ncbi:MAG: acyl carrier protein [Bdellovibrionales bacterium]|nr:acyl carrier protein [Bdellovibrionales bacterium]
MKNLILEFFPKADLSHVEKLGVGTTESWDSVNHFNFMMAVEEEYNVQFSTEEISELKNISQIITSLKEKGVSF